MSLHTPCTVHTTSLTILHTNHLSIVSSLSSWLLQSALAWHPSLPLPDIHKTLLVSPRYIPIQQIGTISEMLHKVCHAHSEL